MLTHLFNVFLAYIIMLAVMQYNWWIFFAVLAGKICWGPNLSLFGINCPCIPKQHVVFFDSLSESSDRCLSVVTLLTLCFSHFIHGENLNHAWNKIFLSKVEFSFFMWRATLLCKTISKFKGNFWKSSLPDPICQFQPWNRNV